MGLGLKETTVSARTSGVSTCSALCDALVDACKEEVSERVACFCIQRGGRGLGAEGDDRIRTDKWSPLAALSAMRWWTEVSEPVGRFCIQRGGLESAAVVGLGLKETTVSARTSGVSTRSALCDVLVDACKEEVGKDGGVGALAEESSNDGAGELACKMVLEKEMDLGNPGEADPLWATSSSCKHIRSSKSRQTHLETR